MYARHGHKLMGCKSPVGGSPLCKLYPTILATTTSRRQGQIREELSEGSPMQNDEPMDKKHPMRPGLEVSLHQKTKPRDSTGRVKGVVVSGKFMFLSGEICTTLR